MSAKAEHIAPLRDFVQKLTRRLESPEEGSVPVASVAEWLKALVADDRWLDEPFRQPHPQYYQQYLLHCDPLERFSVVSFVWGPGQSTPIHDHGVWGAVGMLTGTEMVRDYSRDEQGQLVAGEERALEPGDVVTFAPAEGDIHAVRNAFDDRVSISIHVYGGNIGAQARHVFDAQTGGAKPFVSGYAAAVVPNLWDRSRQVSSASLRQQGKTCVDN